MLLIIGHHCVVHGGFDIASANSATVLFAYALLPAGKIGFVCFVAISMWFFVGKSFKADRFIRVWLEILFYTALLAVASFFFGEEMTWEKWVASLLPIGGISHGFAATYLVFYLFLPFVSKATANLTRSQALWCLGALFYVQVVFVILASLGISNPSLHPFPSEITLFLMCYMLLYYMKRWPLRIQSSRGSLVVLVLLIWASITMVSYGIDSGKLPESIRWVRVLCSDENSLLFIMAGVALFFLFKGICIKPIRAINVLASATFGILLLHDHNIFRPYFWNDVVHMPEIWGMGLAPLWVILVSIAIFMVGFAVDKTRKKLLEDPIVRTRTYDSVRARIDSVFPAGTK